MSAAVMPEGLIYADHFWGEKYHGFQVLQENLKKSEEVVNEIAQFIKERSAVEDDYAKSYHRSVSKITHVIGNGSNIEPIWLLTKGTMDLLSEIHTMMVRNLQDLSRDVTKYKDDVNKSRKDLKQPSVADAVSLMQTTTTCLQKAKETYLQRCTELEKARKEPGSHGKETIKIEAKMIRARDEYKGYVDKYNVVREDFEAKMTEACKKFQTFDRTLYASVQQFMIMFASHVNEMAVAGLQVSAQYREALQHLNADEFIRNFIKNKRTGCDKSPNIVFEEFEHFAHSSSEPFSLISKENMEVNSMPSSCSSSGVMHDVFPPPPQPPSCDLLMMDSISELDRVDTENGRSAPDSSTASLSEEPTSEKKSSHFSSSITSQSNSGPAAKKLSMFMTKRKKTISQSSVDEMPATDSFSASGLFKFSREKRRSKKSTSESDNGGVRTSIYAEDGQSTASSSRSDEKVINGISSIHPLDAPIESTNEEENNHNAIDDLSGLRGGDPLDEHKEDTNWSSCSSDEEDENELQQSKIRALTIRPADKACHVNASVDELRDAIGSITLTRSTTFEKDPWALGGSRAQPLFSQSMSATSLRQPLRSHHTADGRFRTTFSETEFTESNDPPAFSVSMGYNSGMNALARARPRSNTPTTCQMSAAAFSNNVTRKDSTSSFADPWSSSFNLAGESNNSLGESSFNLSQSTGNLMQATISEQRVPIAMAVNEYSHVWFKAGAGADPAAQCVQRTFGTVMISFAASSMSLLTSSQHDFEPLAFRLQNTSLIKTVLPNKQLIDESVSKLSDDGAYTFFFNKQNLASWLNSQKNQRPESSFYNAEVARYELIPTAPANSQPPLFLTAFWKFEPEHTDIRVDYRLNTECAISVPMLNVAFNTSVNGRVQSITSDPQANWNAGTSNLTWTVLEISRHGEVTGSLKARAHMENNTSDVNLDMIGRKPAQVFVQFQCHETSLSGVEVSLVPSDIYHLSMIRKKVLAGKYFCDPELRS